MTRASSQRGDSIVVSTVADTGHKAYPLAKIPQSVSYEDVSDQPEAQPNQPLAWPLSFHGGFGEGTYHPKDSPGYVYNDGITVEYPNIIGPALAQTNIVLTGAANPPQYFFEAKVNDGGADNGKPRLYVISPEAAEVNIYKISLACGDSGTANAAVTTTDTTLSDTRKSWTVNGWIGEIVTCNGKTLTITSNTATTLTGTGGWSGGGNPGNGFAWTIGVGPFGTLLNTKTFTVNTTQPMGRAAQWHNGTVTRWYVPLGDNGYIQELETIASGTAADTWDDGTTHADARHLCVVGQDLHRITAGTAGGIANEVSILPRDSNPLEEANWGDEHYVGDESYNINDIAEANGLSYMAKDNGFFEWDADEAVARNILPFGAATRNGQGMLYWHGGFVIPTASGLWWTRTGKPIGPDSNPHSLTSHSSLALVAIGKHGRWSGCADAGKYLYAVYSSKPSSMNSLFLRGRERDPITDPPGPPIVWHVVDLQNMTVNNFHGCYIAQTGERMEGAIVIRPSVFYPSVNDMTYQFLDYDGGPYSHRGYINLEIDTKRCISGYFDFDLPRVNKQLRVIDGWAENFGSVVGSFQFSIYRDGLTISDIGAAITADGHFERFWTPDSVDTCRSMLVRFGWTGTSSLTSTNGPHLRDVMVRAVAMPDTTRVWTFLLTVRDKEAKTGKLVRSEIESYKNDLKKYKLPDGDSFNGVLTGLRLLRADEVKNLVPANQPPPHYIMQATVRELVAA